MSRSFSLLALAAVLAGSAIAQTTLTRTSSYTFPLVGLAPSETIEVNLINLASNPTSGTAASCTGSVSFMNAASGTIIGGATNFTLAANAVASITPSVTSNVVYAANRALIRVVLETTTTVPGAPCSLASTLTTFDTATGVTHVLLVGTAAVTATPIALFGAVTP